MSHELLEMIADPGIDLTVFIQETATTGTIYALEVADAPEGDQYAYDLPGADGTAVAVSDFVYPAWFQSWRAPGAVRYDQGGHIGAPFQLLPGGYIGVYVLGSAAGWTQRTADHALARPAGLRTAADFMSEDDATALVLGSRAPVGSRRERRRVPRDKWLPSRA